MKAEEAEAPALLIKLSRLQCVLLLNTVCLTHAHTASRYTLIQRLQLMLYIYNLLQTFLYSDMQIGELRGQKHSENLTRVPQSPRVQSQLGGSKISWGGGGEGRGGVKQENATPETIVFSAYRKPVSFIIIISLSFFIIALLLSGELSCPSETPKEALRRDRWKQLLININITAKDIWKTKVMHNVYMRNKS